MKTLFATAAILAIAPIASAAEINIGYSTEFQEKLSEDYGMREGDKLSEDVRKDLEHAFNKAGVDPATVSVTIVDAKPNRPTMQQMSNQPGLDGIRSKSIGGMTLKGVAVDASGQVIGDVEYDWYETNIENVIASSVWSDANRASRNFAKRLAEDASN